MTNIRLRTAIFVILAAFGSLIVQGCSTIPVGRYQALKTSSDEILKTTTETYGRVGKLQRTFVVATAPDKPIDVNTFKPIVDGQSYDITPELQKRENALTILSKYTDLLLAIATKDYQSGIDKASLELDGSLKSIDGKANVSGIAATVVDVLGKEISDYERKKVLDKTMDKAQESVDALCSLIVSSTPKIKRFVTEKIQVTLIQRANIMRPPYGSYARYQLDRETADMIDEVQEINAALDTISEAISRYPNAHREIRISLEEKNTAIEELKALVQEGQRVNKFYQSLK